MTERPPRQQPPPPRGRDYTIVIVLLVLGILAAVLWFSDPAHQWPGRSRVDWPKSATPAP